MDSLIPFLYDSFIRTNLPVYPGVPGHRHPFLQFFNPVEDDIDSSAWCCHSRQTLLPSRGSRYRFVGIPLAVSAVSGIVPV